MAASEEETSSWTEDMTSQDQPGQEAAGFVGLGPEDEGDEVSDAESAGILLMEEGDEEEGSHPEAEAEAAEAEAAEAEAAEAAEAEAEQGAAPAEGEEAGAEEEADEGSASGPGDLAIPGPMYDEHRDSSGDSDGEPGEQRQEEQLQLVIVQHPQPEDGQQVALRTVFTEAQMRELEHIFRRNPYPDFLTRQDIARRMNVSEARVQIWFKNRRRRQRAITLRNVHRMALGDHTGVNVGAPYVTILNPQPVWIWCLQPPWIWYPQPVPLGLLLPPMLPFPPRFLPPPPPFLFPPMPTGAPYRRVWAWHFSVFYP